MNPSDPLDPLLRSWTPDVPDQEGFREAVWSRIASQSAGGDKALRQVVGFRATIMAAAAAVVLGFGLGFLIPEDAYRGDHEAYFERINPLAVHR